MDYRQVLTPILYFQPSPSQRDLWLTTPLPQFRPLPIDLRVFLPRQRSDNYTYIWLTGISTAPEVRQLHVHLPPDRTAIGRVGYSIYTPRLQCIDAASNKIVSSIGTIYLPILDVVDRSITWIWTLNSLLMSPASYQLCYWTCLNLLFTSSFILCFWSYLPSNRFRWGLNPQSFDCETVVTTTTPFTHSY